jgi:hypothetical protein
MATKSQDYTKMMKDMMGSFPVDMSAMQDAFKTQAVLRREDVEGRPRGRREVDRDLDQVDEGHARPDRPRDEGQAEPADYGKAMTDFASAQAEYAAENMAAFAEVAKKVQMETVELMLAAGKDMSEDATAAVKKATTEMTAAAKKAPPRPPRSKRFGFRRLAPPCRRRTLGGLHRPALSFCSALP